MRSAWPILLVVLACSDPISPIEKATIEREAVAVAAPDSARQFWTQLEACSGLRGDFASVRWYVEPNGLMAGGEWRGGVWLADRNAIVLAPPNRKDPFTIRHEEMHALLRGGSNHPARYFNGVCGNLMSPF